MESVHNFLLCQLVCIIAYIHIWWERGEGVGGSKTHGKCDCEEISVVLSVLTLLLYLLIFTFNVDSSILKVEARNGF